MCSLTWLRSKYFLLSSIFLVWFFIVVSELKFRYDYVFPVVCVSVCPQLWRVTAPEPLDGLTWNLVGGMVSHQRPRSRSKVKVTLRSRSTCCNFSNSATVPISLALSFPDLVWCESRVWQLICMTLKEWWYRGQGHFLGGFRIYLAWSCHNS